MTPASVAESLAAQAKAFANQGRLADALQALRRAVNLEPEHWEWLSHLATLAHSLGDLRTAEDSLSRAVGLAPSTWTLRNDLGAVLTEMREWDRAEAELARAAELSGGDPTVSVNRSTVALRRGDARVAVVHLEDCLTSHPDFVPARGALGFALRDLGEFEAAVESLRRAHAAAPNDPKYACGLAGTLLEAGKATEALSEARAYLSKKPGHSGAIALEALAHFALGDAASGRGLLDFEHLISTGELSTPPEFASLAELNTSLAQHVSSHPTLFRAPASHATAEGLHSGSLLVAPKGPVAALESAVSAAIGAYGRLHPVEVGHPWLEHRPRGVFLKMWSVVLERGGHQIPHIHPSAWLSGVYYPKLPESVKDAEGPEGWLEFGGSERPFPSKLELPTFRVRPKEGLLVLFPSYFFHRTIPFDGEGTRVSVAFDVVPA